MTKECTKCGEERARDCFCRQSRSSDGLQSWCKDCNRDYRQKNAIAIRESNRRYVKQNPEKVSASRRSYYRRERGRLLDEKKEYYLKNRDKVHAKNAAYDKRRKRTDPAYALHRKVRCQVTQAFRGKVRSPGFFRHMPYTRMELAEHLLSTLPEGYTEDDACDGSKLHIDHIRPVSSFKLTGEIDDDFLECWALDNLRLLPAAENLSKSNKWHGSP